MKEEDQVCCKKLSKSDIDSTRHGVLDAILRGRWRCTKKLHIVTWHKRKIKYSKMGSREKTTCRAWEEKSVLARRVCMSRLFPYSTIFQTKFGESKSSSLSAKNFLFGNQHTNWMKALCFGWRYWHNFVKIKLLENVLWKISQKPKKLYFPLNVHGGCCSQLRVFVKAI